MSYGGTHPAVGESSYLGLARTRYANPVRVGPIEWCSGMVEVEGGGGEHAHGGPGHECGGDAMLVVGMLALTLLRLATGDLVRGVP